MKTTQIRLADSTRQLQSASTSAVAQEKSAFDSAKAKDEIAHASPYELSIIEALREGASKARAPGQMPLAEHPRIANVNPFASVVKAVITAITIAIKLVVSIPLLLLPGVGSFQALNYMWSRESAHLESAASQDGLGVSTAEMSLIDLPQDLLRWSRGINRRKASPESVQIKRNQNIIMFGPPGLGKSAGLRQLCSQNRYDFLEANSADLMNKYLGESEKSVQKLFDRARRLGSEGRTAIIFFDELDCSFGRSRDTGSDHRGITNAFAEMLKNMDKAARTQPNVIVAAATNHLGRIDPSLLRRFGRKIEFKLPEAVSRARFIGDRFGRSNTCLPEAELLTAVKESNGFNFGQLENAIEDTFFLAEDEGVNVANTHLKKAFESACQFNSSANQDETSRICETIEKTRLVTRLVDRGV